MGQRVLLVHDAERVQANLKLDGFPIDALLAQALDQLGRKMQAGRRGRRRAFATRIHRLVQLLIASIMLDVRRQRRMPHRVKRLVKRGVRGGQTSHALTALGALGPVDDLGGQRNVAFAVREIDHRAATGLQALARTHEHLPDGLLVFAGNRLAGDMGHVSIRLRLRTHKLAKQEHLGLPACAALRAEQARRQNARVVRHQQIAGFQIIDDVAEDAVLDRAGFAVHDQHAARIAHRRRLLRDELLGKIVIEIARFHRDAPCRTPSILRRTYKRPRHAQPNSFRTGRLYASQMVFRACAKSPHALRSKLTVIRSEGRSRCAPRILKQQHGSRSTSHPTPTPPPLRRK